MENSKLKTKFDRDGFVCCRGFAADNIETINLNLERVVKELVPSLPGNQVFYEDPLDPTTLKQIQLLNQLDPYFSKLAGDGPFRDLAAALLGEQVECHNMQYFNKPPGIGLATPAHQDGFYFKLDPPIALTMWMALEDVDEENGCVRYVRGSHLSGMRDHGKTGTLGFSQGISDFPNDSDHTNEVAFPASPGDLLAHHALTIHRADGNQSKTRTRRALGFIYYGVSAREDPVARARYKAELKSDRTKTGTS